MTWSAAVGHVFLFDVEARQRVSAWTLPVCERGFSDAAGIAMDPNFHLFVADPQNDRVRHFSVFGRHLGDFGRPAPASGDAARDRPGVLDRPHATAVRGDTLYVAAGDQPRRHAVQRFTRRGQVASPLWSEGDLEREFGAPRALVVDGHGILVADTLNGRLQRFRGDGTFLAVMATGERGAMSRPVAVARRRDGSIVIVDRGDAGGCRLFAADGRRLSLPIDLEQHCEHPIGLCLDQRDRLYVLDQHGERVQRFAADFAFDGVIVDLCEHVDDYEPGSAEP